MQPTDWNWFFSSVAQSAAAIVGIFGAFIVTKILSNQAAYSERCRRLEDLIVQGQRLADAATRLSFAWYHKHTNAKQVSALEDLLEKEGGLEPRDLYSRLTFSPYLRREDALDVIERALGYRRARKEQEREDQRRAVEESRLLGIRVPLPQGISPAVLRSLNAPQEALQQSKLAHEREVIDALYTDARHHRRTVAEFYASIETHPESSRVITWALGLILALFLVGVIYPLSLMPLPLNRPPILSLDAVPEVLFSLRGTLLSAVSILFATMLCIFLVMNLRLKYSSAALERLAPYRDLSTYSSHFAVRQVNDDAKSEIAA